jgi:tetratricopeptide (TPR) repeat protein
MRVRLPAFVSVLALAAVAAFAGDGQVVLRFKDGRLLPGKVTEISEKGVRHVSDQGGAFWPWELLTLYGQYEARAAAIAEDDGPARLALARWCLDAGLPGEGRKETLRARGLGAGEAKDLDAMLLRCDREQAEAAFAEARRKSEAGDFDGALAVLRSYLVQAPASEWTEKGREQAAEIVRLREADEARRRFDEERRKRVDTESRRALAVEDLLAEGDDFRTRAGVLALVGLREEDGGSFTTFRQSLERAEGCYQAARKSYERARRLAGDESPEHARLALAGRHAVDGRLLDLYLRLARKFVDFKAWKDAQAAVDRALRIDPVNAEGLELQDRIKAGWIRRKASDLTNAGGSSNDGTTDR